MPGKGGVDILIELARRVVGDIQELDILRLCANRELNEEEHDGDFR